MHTRGAIAAEQCHMLTNVDAEARTATCSKCGPVDVLNGGRGRFRCAPNHRLSLGRRRYGPTYERPFEGVCPICRRRRRLVYDHDHQTGLKRGNICSTCNGILGMVDDKPQILRAAAQYLEETASARVVPNVSTG